MRNGQVVRYGLEEAALKVSVSKKSLDDYLLQLRFGKKYEFDFQAHKQSKVGVLRAYVKKCKELDKKNSAAGGGKQGKQSSMIENTKK